MGSRQRREQREASYRRHQEDVCASKIGYPSAQAAKNAARHHHARLTFDGVLMHEYKCPVCHKWHLTKKPR